MYQYFIVSNILTRKHIEKLKKYLHFITEDELEILTDDGLYKIKDDKIYKFNISNSIKPIKFELLNLSIIQQEQLFHKINKNINHIPFNNKPIQLKKIIFKQSKHSKFSFHVVFKNDEIINYYFLSHLEHSDFNFKEDISYFLRMLM
tara:strand:+ start:791 stop:1231 length:441 start_codon:yes stop_codon:yes gene_type:complete